MVATLGVTQTAFLASNAEVIRCASAAPPVPRLLLVSLLVDLLLFRLFRHLPCASSSSDQMMRRGSWVLTIVGHWRLSRLEVDSSIRRSDVDDDHENENDDDDDRGRRQRSSGMRVGGIVDLNLALPSASLLI